jgi:DNA-binding NarL/FixJ family response regulator
VTAETLIKVLCVDDAAPIVQAVQRKLELEGGFAFVGMLPSADTLIEEVERTRPHVVLLDIDMPGRDPFDAMAELARRFPDVRVVMLSGHIRRELIDSAFAAGAWGYLSKNDSVSEIPAGVRRVQAGEVIMSNEVRSVFGA